MINRKLISFSLILLILIVSLGIVSAEDNLTIPSQNNPKNTNSLANEKTFEYIQTQINRAIENDTIELNGTYICSGKEIKINKSITIQGNKNAILDGKKSSGIFKITTKNSKITLKNITIINAFTKTTETNDKIIYHSAINIPKSNNHLILENCNFINNTGSLIKTDSKVTCKNSIFENNNAPFDNMMDLQINLFKSCNFTNNKCDYLLRSKISNITYCNFSENFATEIIILTDTANVISSNFIMNNAKVISINGNEKSSIINSNFENNVEGISIGGNSNIINSKFINSRVSLTPYWPPYYEPYWYIETSNSIIINSTFKSNIDTALYCANNLKLYNSTFENNSDKKSGSLYIIGATCNVNNCSFKNNTKVAIAMESNIDYLWFTNTKYGKLTINNKTYKYYVNLNEDLKEINTLNLSAVKKAELIYNSGKRITFMLTADNSPYKNGLIQIKVFTNKKSKTYYITTNSKGIGTFDASKLTLGSHNIIINCYYYNIAKKELTVKVTKAKTIVKAPKVTNKYKKSKYFKIFVKHKTTKKPIKKTYVKIKIDKKIYKVKTDSKGIGKINTKKLKIGKHKVTITSGNSNYQMNAKSTITIKRE